VDERGSLLGIAGKLADDAAAEALRRWLLRPEQARLFRRAWLWSESLLLFPAPDGKPLSRSVFGNAFRRFTRAEGRVSACWIRRRRRTRATDAAFSSALSRASARPLSK
jgi:hypothetical protein